MTGFTCGVFDLFHAGHVLMLRDCKRQCDYLLVGLKVNPKVDQSEKNLPVQTLLERRIQLNGCRHVDEVVVYETEKDLEIILSNMDIQKRFVGDDHKDEEFTGKKICEDRGIEIIYNHRKHPWSSSSLRERVKKAK